MRLHAILKATLFSSLLLAVVAAGASAQPSGRGGMYGDWPVKVQFGERQMDSILSFSRDDQGNLTAQWISLWGVTDLKDVKFEDGKLSFVQTVRFGDNDFTQTFNGTVQDGKLTGTLSSDRGESKVEGQRGQRTPRAAGTWELKYKMGERDITSTLVIAADKEGQLTGQWQSQRGETTISDLQYERGALSFKRTSKMGDRQFEGTFSGTIEDDKLVGTFKSERGEAAVEGTRVGAPVIGTWNLDVTGDRGTTKQRLTVNPDMTGLYGAMPVGKVSFEDGKVSFKITMQFGDQPYEMSFAGKLEDGKLTGELTTSRGTRKVVGTKVIRQFRRRSNV